MTNTTNVHRGPRAPEVRTRQANRYRETSIVKQYLSALRDIPVGRGGFKLTPETVERRIASLREDLGRASSPLDELLLRQKIKDLEKATTTKHKEQISKLEEQFVSVAASFSERQGIDADIWRATGVTRDVLKRAGIK